MINYVEENPESRVDPMSRVFPRMTKCIYTNHGPSGTKQIHDSLCMLPMNVINEKIYVFIWFWLVFLICITGLNIVYHAVLLFSPNTLSQMVKGRLRHRVSLAVSVKGVQVIVSVKTDWLIDIDTLYCSD